MLSSPSSALGILGVTALFSHRPLPSLCSLAPLLSLALSPSSPSCSRRPLLSMIALLLSRPLVSPLSVLGSHHSQVLLALSRSLQLPSRLSPSSFLGRPRVVPGPLYWTCAFLDAGAFVAGVRQVTGRCPEGLTIEPESTMNANLCHLPKQSATDRSKRTKAKTRKRAGNYHAFTSH
uniref:Uncharacterized protein n=1 Tax=Knipowitschia caucasica TaxID=637954 RepID=A0AAV2JK20_KNICA